MEEGAAEIYPKAESTNCLPPELLEQDLKRAESFCVNLIFLVKSVKLNIETLSISSID